MKVSLTLLTEGMLRVTHVKDLLEQLRTLLIRLRTPAGQCSYMYHIAST